MTTTIKRAFDAAAVAGLHARTAEQQTEATWALDCAHRAAAFELQGRAEAAERCALRGIAAAERAWPGASEQS